MQIRLRRAYEAQSAQDGYRVLVDRLWPRGIKKEELLIDAWMKDIAPSAELRKAFAHDTARWEEFKEKYFRELDDRSGDLEKLRVKLREGRVTLVYAAKDEEHNNAVALKEYLEKKAT